MRYEFNFGNLTACPPAPAAMAGGSFRIAVLGDFSGRANRGELEIGAALAQRKPIRLDVENIESVLRGFASVLHLPIGADGDSIALHPRSLDELHPDALFESVDVFSELAALRQRLENPKTCKAAAQELEACHGMAPISQAPGRPGQARGSTFRVDAKLSDFARLIGRPTVAHASSTPVAELVRQLVAPYCVEAEDPDRQHYVAAIDQALSATMRRLLQDPDFQALEAAWRALDFLVRRIETSARLHIVVYDISAEELAADLSSSDALEDSGLYRLLVEQPALDAHQGPLSVLIGNYTFEMTPPHAELLGRMARIAAAARAPFIAAIGPDCISTRTEDLHPLVVQAWDGLRALPEASFVALTVPRFLLRAPYGAKSEPIDSFEFEEFDPHDGLRPMLWGHSAILAAVLLAEHFRQQGWKMTPGKILSVADLPHFFYHDADGDQIALPCTECLLTERKAGHLGARNLIAALAIKGRPEIRLAGFRSLAGSEIAGPWTPFEKIEARLSPPAAPEAQTVQSAIGADVLAAEIADSESEAQSSNTTLASPKAEVSTTPDTIEIETADAELDALLAALNTPSEAAVPSDDDEMDPELAALLKEL